MPHWLHVICTLTLCTMTAGRYVLQRRPIRQLLRIAAQQYSAATALGSFLAFACVVVSIFLVLQAWNVCTGLTSSEQHRISSLRRAVKAQQVHLALQSVHLVYRHYYMCSCTGLWFQQMPGFARVHFMHAVVCMLTACMPDACLVPTMVNALFVVRHAELSIQILYHMPSRCKRSVTAIMEDHQVISQHGRRCRAACQPTAKASCATGLKCWLQAQLRRRTMQSQHDVTASAKQDMLALLQH